MASSPLSTEPSQNCDCPSFVWLCVCVHLLEIHTKAYNQHFGTERKKLFIELKSHEGLWWCVVLCGKNDEYFTSCHRRMHAHADTCRHTPSCLSGAEEASYSAHTTTNFYRQSKIKTLVWCNEIFHLSWTSNTQLHYFCLLLLEYQVWLYHQFCSCCSLNHHIYLWIHCEFTSNKLAVYLIHKISFSKSLFCTESVPSDSLVTHNYYYCFFSSFYLSASQEKAFFIFLETACPHPWIM